MIYPDVSVEEGCGNRHFTVKKSRCLSCNKSIATTTPFIDKKYIGLIAPICECGYNSGFSIQRSRDKSFKSITSIGSNLI